MDEDQNGNKQNNFCKKVNEAETRAKGSTENIKIENRFFKFTKNEKRKVEN